MNITTETPIEMPATPRVVRVDLENLRDAAASGTFTPVIGAACSTLEYPREPRSELIKEIRLKARVIARELDEAEKKYLDELIDYDTVNGEDPQIAQALLNFYVALLRFDRCSTRVFKTAATQETNDAGDRCEFLWKRRYGSSLPRSLSDWQAPLAPSPHKKQFRERLDALIEAVEDLKRSPGERAWREQGLGADGICNNLSIMKKEWFDDSGQPRTSAALNLIDLVWLGNLFWHTLRFDRPYYPTTTELAFQLSLHTEGGTGPSNQTPPMLAQAAQALGYPHVLSCLTGWFRKYGENGGKSEFYDSIARWLQSSFRRLNDYKRAWGGAAWPFPLTFTTNYDREIELALEKAQCQYHVVFPVDFIYRKRSRSTVFESFEPPRTSLWLMKTITKDGITWHYAGQTIDASQTNQDAADPYKPEFDFVGPLVIKLHGSPVEELPDQREPIENLPTDLQEWSNTQKYLSQYRHRIILTESDYLTDLRRRDLPRWLLDRMQTEKRDLFFLGQSISDWNIRLRLADRALWGSSETNSEAMLTIRNTEPRYHRFAVNRVSRYFDAAFMGPLRIAQVEAELDRVQTILAHAL